MKVSRVYHFAHLPWVRRTGWLAATSLVLALMLTGYVFGFSNHFFGRLSGAFFVIFWLLAVTFLGVVPFVNWAAANWFGKAWAEMPPEPARRIPRSAPVSSPIRKVGRPAARPDSFSKRP
ncbi:hypothetical protein [Hymenobacter daecheongensis]|uniref:hypothetical protein n=1 Tax=Hymenobacter daecheongensis TaxID=496053 RepID=UPI00116102C7|nr:hypothetical protein [Hymenobacter daecheongensis]